MTKLGLIGVLAGSILLAGCGGSSKTVTVTNATPTPVAPASTSTGVAATGLNPSAVAACLRAAGAKVKEVPAGPATEVYGITSDGVAIGAIKAPNAVVAGQIQHTFSLGGYKISPLSNDPTAFAIYKGKLRTADSALLSKCTK